MHTPTRREVVVAGGLAAAAALAWPAHAQTGAAPLTRIAFGSCARQRKDQPIWDVIAAAEPQLYVSLGDAVYADTEDPETMAEAYARLAEKPAFQRLKARTPMCAIWDDHDYGANDAGADYPMKAESRRQFCDFWGEPASSLRRTRLDGIYASYLFGAEGQRVQLILPDLRWNRQPGDSSGGFLRLARQYIAGHLVRGRPVAGPYQTVDDPAAERMLGAAQWAWLEAQFQVPADLRVIGSSLQVLSRGTGWEAWEQFPAELERLLALIGPASNVVLLSGDVHYGEITRLDRPAAPPLYDLTSSGLTEVWATLPPNTRRQEAFRGRNFGLVDIDWQARAVSLRVCDEFGAERLRQDVSFV